MTVLHAVATLVGLQSLCLLVGSHRLSTSASSILANDIHAVQVWDQDLQPFKNQRFALSLDNSPLVVALQHLVQEATKTNCRPTAAAAAHERQLKATFFSRTVAFNLVQQLPEATCAMPLIQTVPLVQLASPLQTLEAFHYDPAHLHLLPSHLQHLYTSGRLAGVKAPQRSRFWPMDFANTSALRRAPGASPGIYQIFLCRYETDSKGQRKLISRTEWYNGAASIGKGCLQNQNI